MIGALWLIGSVAHAECAIDCPDAAAMPTLWVPATATLGVSTTAAPVVAGVLDAGIRVAATGVLLATEFEPIAGSSDLGQVRPLEPMPSDTVLGVWQLDDAGDPLDWLGDFETGSDPDVDDPLAPSELAVDTGHYNKSRCSPSEDYVEASWAPVDDAEGVLYEARFTHPDGETLMTTAFPDARITSLGLCGGGLLPELAPGEAVEVQVRSVDLSGNRSPWSDPVVDALAPPLCGCASATNRPNSKAWGSALVRLVLRRRPSRL